jgi:hypothetical protein
MTTPSPTPPPAPPPSASPTLLERIGRAPGRVAGIVAALAAVVLLLVSSLDLLLISENTDQVTIVRTVLGLNVIALLGFVPLLYAVHAAAARRARPPWLLLVAYLVLLIRPGALAFDLAAAWSSGVPSSALGGAAVPFLLLATTGLAAGLAAVALQPTHNVDGEPVGSPVRSIVIGGGVGLFVALTLFAFAPYIAPLSAMGLAVALSFRKPPLPPDPWEERAEEDGDPSR